jgi:IclR family transcriptional regulator, acetate operon repressor
VIHLLRTLHGGHVVAISVPAPTERFRANEKQIVAALRKAAKSAAWSS